MRDAGSSTNLAPFSYTQMVNHDPPIFVVGFAGGMENAKDTLKNIVDTGECEYCRSYNKGNLLIRLRLP